MTKPLRTGWKRILLPCLPAVVMMTATGKLQAQNTSIVVQPGSTVMVTGGYTHLKDADLLCNGQWLSGGGVTLFTGANATSAGGSGSIRLWTVGIAKSQTVPIELTAGLQVNSALNFTRGLIDLNGQVLQLTNTARLSGESDSGRVTGLLGGKIVTEPINANQPNQLNLGNLGAMISSTANLGILSVNRSSMPGNVGSLGIQRTYLIQPQNNTALNATLRFYYLDAELNGNDPGKLNLWKSTDGIAWGLMGADIRDTVNHYVEKAGIADFSYWTLSALTSALPLKLVSFSAVCAGNAALIEWQTGLESQLKDFLVQRSTDGNSWLTIGRVTAQNAANGAGYSYKDIEPQPHDFYRLKIEDQDGTITYSPTFSGGCSDIALPFLVYPNPATSQVGARISLRKTANGNLQVLNVSGAVLYEAEWKLTAGLNQLVIPLAGWPSGSYILRLVTAEGVQTTQFIKL